MGYSRIVHHAIRVAGALALSGCAAQMIEQAQKQCALFGYDPTSPEFARCVEADYNRQSEQIAAAGRGLQQNAAAHEPAMV